MPGRLGGRWIHADLERKRPGPGQGLNAVLPARSTLRTAAPDRTIGAPDVLRGLYMREKHSPGAPAGSKQARGRARCGTRPLSFARFYHPGHGVEPRRTSMARITPFPSQKRSSDLHQGMAIVVAYSTSPRAPAPIAAHPAPILPGPRNCRGWAASAGSHNAWVWGTRRCG
jgi:hypothetical protein